MLNFASIIYSLYVWCFTNVYFKFYLINKERNFEVMYERETVRIEYLIRMRDFRDDPRSERERLQFLIN